MLQKACNYIELGYLLYYFTKKTIQKKEIKIYCYIHKILLYVIFIVMIKCKQLNKSIVRLQKP